MRAALGAWHVLGDQKLLVFGQVVLEYFARGPLPGWTVAG